MKSIVLCIKIGIRLLISFENLISLWKHFVRIYWKFYITASKGGAVVSGALASDQCGAGSGLGVEVIYGKSLLLVLSLTPRGNLSVLRFPRLFNNTSKFQFDLEGMDTFQLVVKNS